MYYLNNFLIFLYYLDEKFNHCELTIYVFWYIRIIKKSGEKKKKNTLDCYVTIPIRPSQGALQALYMHGRTSVVKYGVMWKLASDTPCETCHVREAQAKFSFCSLKRQVLVRLWTCNMEFCLPKRQFQNVFNHYFEHDSRSYIVTLKMTILKYIKIFFFFNHYFFIITEHKFQKLFFLLLVTPISEGENYFFYCY